MANVCWKAAAGCLLLFVGIPVYAADEVETAPAFEDPALSPSLLDFVTGMPVAKTAKELATPKLMREPFAGAPVDTVKGLASKIKAQQVDAKNREKAAEFLGTVDCVVFPESQQLLVKTMQEDPSEKVRLAAVEALKEQMGRGRSKKNLLGKFSKKEERRYDTCRGCCGEKVMNALAERAYETDEQGCPLEPSERVREAAREALQLCATCSHCQQCQASWTDTDVPPTPEPETSGEAYEPAPKTEQAEPAAPVEQKAVPAQPAPKTLPAPPAENSRASIQPALSPVQRILAKRYARAGLKPPAAMIPSATPELAPETRIAQENPTEPEPSQEVIPVKAETEAVESSATTESPESKSVTVIQPLSPVQRALQNLYARDGLKAPEKMVPATSVLPSEHPATTNELGRSNVQRMIAVLKSRRAKEATSFQPPIVIGQHSTPAPLPTVQEEPASEILPVKAERIAMPIACLRGYCPVAMVEHQLVKANDAFSTTYEGHAYTFASQEAKDKFLADPEKYVPVNEGYDIIVEQRTGQREVGNFVATYNGRQYWFATLENKQEFRQSPDRFVSE